MMELNLEIDAFINKDVKKILPKETKKKKKLQQINNNVFCSAPFWQTGHMLMIKNVVINIIIRKTTIFKKGSLQISNKCNFP